MLPAAVSAANCSMLGSSSFLTLRLVYPMSKRVLCPFAAGAVHFGVRWIASYKPIPFTRPREK
eukprot:scaffold80318_cov18-Tisochrysis_lutea.AAC.1